MRMNTEKRKRSPHISWRFEDSSAICDMGEDPSLPLSVCRQRVSVQLRGGPRALLLLGLLHLRGHGGGRGVHRRAQRGEAEHGEKVRVRVGNYTIHALSHGRKCVAPLFFIETP